ncbi:MAG: hypothetical protein AB7L41_00520 [Flavobacteriaceae bacterium]
MTRLFAGILLALLAASGAAAENFSFYGSAHREGSWNGPGCDEPRVLGAIQRRFDRTEAEYWDGMRMLTIDRVRETAFDDWEPTIIARRYCSARATFSDGQTRGLVYWLRSEQGFAGLGWGFQYCVLGRDRFNTYAPGCKVLRPY